MPRSIRALFGAVRRPERDQPGNAATGVRPQTSGSAPAWPAPERKSTPPLVLRVPGRQASREPFGDGRAQLEMAFE